MANDDVMALDKQLGRLEETVARGFSEIRSRFDEQDKRLGAHDKRFDAHDKRFDRLEGRMASLEDRMAALESKFDVYTDTIRGDIKTVLEAVTAGTEEARRTADAIRREHAADRDLTRTILLDHSNRLRSLEHRLNS